MKINQEKVERLWLHLFKLCEKKTPEKKEKGFDSLPPTQQGESEQAEIYHFKQQMESLEASVIVDQNMEREIDKA